MEMQAFVHLVSDQNPHVKESRGHEFIIIKPRLSLYTAAVSNCDIWDAAGFQGIVVALNVRSLSLNQFE
jgi:hypothetical protein